MLFSLIFADLVIQPIFGPTNDRRNRPKAFSFLFNGLIRARNRHEGADEIGARQRRQADQGVGLFDDLPEPVRSGFMDQVLKALPFIRNKLGGHEQSAAVVDIPPACGDLTIQIAADFQNFLITKHLERSPAPVTPPPARNAPSSVDDEIPF